tara:strand:- start:327 stop:1634 length:1308 start_codon:yes stop_codon:yes gene_type:complete
MQTLFILLLAFTLRLINIFTHDLSISNHILEDQVMYWGRSGQYAYDFIGRTSNPLFLDRMPGAFLFFQLGFYFLGENLTKILIFQSLLSSINCIVIAFIAKLISKKLFIYAGLFAAISPISIILSNMVLSDTVYLLLFSLYFLFFMTYFEKKRTSLLYLAGIFLGLSCFVRLTSVFFIPLSIVAITIIFYKRKKNIFAFLKASILFTFLSTLPILERLISNYNNYSSIFLTTQTGNHLAYWVVPAVLDFENIKDKEAYYSNLNNLEKKLEVEKSAVERYKKLKSFATSQLIRLDIENIALAWTKGAMLNIFSPTILLDNRIRKLKHPSFYENNKNIIIWLKKIFYIQEFKSYKYVFFFSLVTSLFSLISIIIGFSYLYKKNIFQFIFVLASFFIICVITGPVFSPKYIFPIIPLFFILQAIVLRNFYSFIFLQKN